MGAEMDTELTPKAQRILECASKLFYDNGIHAVGVDTIAREAGVTKKTLYERFGSKEGLIAMYLQDRDRRWLEFRSAALTAAGPSCAEQLAAAFDASGEWSAANGGKGCSFINAHAEFSDPSHPVSELVAAQKRETLELFRRILAGGGVAEDSTVEAVMLLHEGALVAHGIGIGADPWGSARDAALHLLVGRD